MKFKVGDIVRIDNLDVTGLSTSSQERYKELIGQFIKIDYVYSDELYPYCVHREGEYGDLYFKEEELSTGQNRNGANS